MNLQNEFKSKFPTGFYEEYTSPSTGSVFITLGLIEKLDDVNHRIRENDPMHHIFKISQLNDGKYEVTAHSNTLSLEPTNKYLAMHCLNTKFRKCTGDLTKINKHLIKFFGNLRELVDANKDKIYNKQMYQLYLN